MEAMGSMRTAQLWEAAEILPGAGQNCCSRPLSQLLRSRMPHPQLLRQIRNSLKLSNVFNVWLQSGDLPWVTKAAWKCVHGGLWAAGLRRV